MTGPKTNEGATKVGQRVGTRAQVRFVRSSAYKAREVLNLIRGMDVRTADETLQLVQRDIAIVIRKCLASAVANAVNNDQQSADELFITACFADEGATLKRFRPRARGRAFRIRKRTTHITIIVARMADAKLEMLRKNEAAKPASVRGRRGAQSVATARRDRVARSRAAGTGAAAAPADHDHDHDHDHGDAASTTPATLVDASATAGELHPYGDGSHASLDDGSQPDGFPIKGNAQSMLFHDSDSRYYTATKAEVWFATAEAAEAAGFSRPGSQAVAASDEPDEAADPEAFAALHPYGKGSHAPLEDGSEPDGYAIKGNAQSMLYHSPDSRYYKATKAEAWFVTEEAAEAAGFSKPGSQSDDEGDK